jgi:hypothetical protein
MTSMECPLRFKDLRTPIEHTLNMDTSQNTDVMSVSAADPTDTVCCDLLDSHSASTDAAIGGPEKACPSPLYGASAPQTKSADPDPSRIATKSLSNATGETNPPLPQEHPFAVASAI